MQPLPFDASPGRHSHASSSSLSPSSTPRLVIDEDTFSTPRTPPESNPEYLPPSLPTIPGRVELLAKCSCSLDSPDDQLFCPALVCIHRDSTRVNSFTQHVRAHAALLSVPKTSHSAPHSGPSSSKTLQKQVLKIEPSNVKIEFGLSIIKKETPARCSISCAAAPFPARTPNSPDLLGTAIFDNAIDLYNNNFIGDLDMIRMGLCCCELSRPGDAETCRAALCIHKDLPSPSPPVESEGTRAFLSLPPLSERVRLTRILGSTNITRPPIDERLREIFGSLPTTPPPARTFICDLSPGVAGRFTAPTPALNLPPPNDGDLFGRLDFFHHLLIINSDFSHRVKYDLERLVRHPPPTIRCLSDFKSHTHDQPQRVSYYRTQRRPSHRRSYIHAAPRRPRSSLHVPRATTSPHLHRRSMWDVKKL